MNDEQLSMNCENVMATLRVNPTPLTLRGKTFDWGQRTYLMGVLNVTPDSFSDGGEFNTQSSALAQAKYLMASGADIIDVGGQSTRPGAAEVSLEEELHRVIPVVQAIRVGGWGLENPGLETINSQSLIPISVDTTRVAVARAAVAAGADIINDISSGTFDPDMLPGVAELGVPIVLMHIRGTPQTMQQFTDYEDLIGEIYEFLDRRVEVAIASGIARDKIIIDPGIGFAKTYEQNLEILRRLDEFRTLGCSILVGPSRKSFIGRILNQPDPKARVWGTAAASAAAIAKGADILRVHDVEEIQAVSRVADAIFRINK